MTGRTVHDGAVGDVLAIMNEDGPQVDKSEQEDVGKLLQGENEGEDVVRDTLGPAIEREACVGSCIRGGGAGLGGSSR